MPEGTGKKCAPGAPDKNAKEGHAFQYVRSGSAVCVCGRVNEFEAPEEGLTRPNDRRQPARF